MPVGDYALFLIFLKNLQKDKICKYNSRVSTQLLKANPLKVIHLNLNKNFSIYKILTKKTFCGDYNNF